MKTQMMTATAAILAGFRFPVAFEPGTAGWKKDAEGKLVLDANGDPIWIDPSGREAPIQGNTIERLNREAKTHREAKEKAEGDLAKFKDIDPELARKAIEDIKKIDTKKLIDAGEVDKVRQQISAEFQTQLAEKDKALTGVQSELDNMRIGSVFTQSEFIRERIALPQDMVQAYFKDRFKLEGGKAVAYYPDGNPVMSKKSGSIGNPATPDEALELLVEAHPQKDLILKAPSNSGSGNNGNGGARGGGAVIRRKDFEGMTPVDQAATSQRAAKGEVSIVD